MNSNGKINKNAILNNRIILLQLFKIELLVNSYIEKFLNVSTCGKINRNINVIFININTSKKFKTTLNSNFKFNTFLLLIFKQYINVNDVW